LLASAFWGKKRIEVREISVRLAGFKSFCQLYNPRYTQFMQIYAASAQTAAAAFLHRNGRRRWEIEVGKQEFFLVFGRLSYAPLPAKKLNMLIS